MFQKYWKNNKRHLLMPFEAVLNRNKKVLKSTDFSTFMVAEAGLEPTTSGL